MEKNNLRIEKTILQKVHMLGKSLDSCTTKSKAIRNPIASCLTRGHALVSHRA